MSNNMRHRWGETNPIMCPVVASAVIEIGDMLVLFDANNMLDGTTYSDTATYKVYPFDCVQSGGQTQSEVECSDHFIGVAEQASPSGDSYDIRVATDGVFEYPLNSATTIYIGDMIEVYSTANNAMKEQQVTKGTTDPLGRAVEAGSSVSYVKLHIATKYRPVWS